MKNLLFGAVMLMGTFAFANSNSSQETIHLESNVLSVYQKAMATCYVTIYVRNKQGDIIGQHEFVHENVESQEECDRLARLHAFLLS